MTMLRLFLALLLAAPAAADPAGNPLADLVAGTDPRSPQLSGVIAVVAAPDRIVRAEAHGLADIAAGRALGVDSPVRVASVSKLVVAIAVWRLVAQGTLTMDQDVSIWLGWKLRHPGYRDAPLTLRHLLSHTSGLIDGPGYAFQLEDRLQDKVTAGHWDAEPGRRFAYANINYGIIASVMEAATGERFDRLMTRLVLKPLRIDGGYNWQGASDAAIARAAVLYRKGRDETAWDSTGPWVAQVDDLKARRPACPVDSRAGCDLAAYVPGSNGTIFSPQGGLRITLPDLARIGQMLLNGGRVGNVRLLPRWAVRAMLTPVWQAGGPKPVGLPGDDYHGQMLCYGAGLQCLSGKADATDQPVQGARWWGHLGEAHGLLSGLWIDPQRRRVYAYALTGSAADPFGVQHIRSAFSAPEDIIIAELAK